MGVGHLCMSVCVCVCVCSLLLLQSILWRHLLSAGCCAPLAGVIISVGKKLAVHQTKYNSIVAEVGGD